MWPVAHSSAVGNQGANTKYREFDEGSHPGSTKAVMDTKYRECDEGSHPSSTGAGVDT